LKVVALEDDNDLQELVLTVHHCYMFALMNTGTFKIIENHKGAAFAKQQVLFQVSAQDPPQRGRP